MRNELFQAYTDSIGPKEATTFKRKLSQMSDTEKQVLENQLKGMFHEIRNKHIKPEGDDLFQSTAGRTLQAGGEFDPDDLFTPIIDGVPVTYDGLIPVDQQAYVVKTEDQIPKRPRTTKKAPLPNRGQRVAKQQETRQQAAQPQIEEVVRPNNTTIPNNRNNEDLSHFFRETLDRNIIEISPQFRGINQNTIQPIAPGLTPSDVQAYREENGMTIFRKDGNDYILDKDNNVRRYLKFNTNTRPIQVERESTSLRNNINETFHESLRIPSSNKSEGSTITLKNYLRDNPDQILNLDNIYTKNSDIVLNSQVGSPIKLPKSTTDNFKTVFIEGKRFFLDNTTKEVFERTSQGLYKKRGVAPNSKF